MELRFLSLSEELIGFLYQLLESPAAGSDMNQKILFGSRQCDSSVTHEFDTFIKQPHCVHCRLGVISELLLKLRTLTLLATPLFACDSLQLIISKAQELSCRFAREKCFGIVEDVLPRSVVALMAG